MKSDRELLELAAKAAGIDAHWGNSWQSDRLFYSLARPHSPLVTYVEWNPLTDDGDALRLAVKLNLGISIPVHQTICADVVCFRDSSVNVREEGSDPYAATRRAIVRAAAAIGKQA